ncbi:MAG: glycosyltransferase family 1 protein [Bacteroidota bacterium]
MKKIRVAFFAEILIQDFDGASRTMFQILDRIPKEEFEFIFFCGVPPDKTLGFEVVQLPTFRIPFNSTYRAVFPHFSKRRMRKKLEEFQPDVIHFASPSPLGKFAKEYGLKNNIPVIAIYHTHFITYIKYYLRKVPFLTPFFYRKAIGVTKDIYHDPDLVYAPTQQIIHELKTICGLEGKNLKLWQRGINPNLFSPDKKDNAFLKKITKNDLPTILFVSRLVWEKNLQTLIDLYELSEKENAKVNFVVAGDGVARKEAERKMPKVHFLGMIDHERLAKLYASADIYFFPSDTETFGNVVIEAMASGIPVVVADGGGPKSFVQNGINGFLCPTKEVRAYWEKIQLLLNDEVLRAKIINNALTFTRTLSWEHLVSIYFQDIKKLAGHPATPPLPSESIQNNKT